MAYRKGTMEGGAPGEVLLMIIVVLMLGGVGMGLQTQEGVEPWTLVM